MALSRCLIFALVSLVVALVVFPVSAQAQFGAIKKLGGKVVGGTTGGISGVIKGVKGNEEGKENAENNEVSVVIQEKNWKNRLKAELEAVYQPTVLARGGLFAGGLALG